MHIFQDDYGNEVFAFDHSERFFAEGEIADSVVKAAVDEGWDASVLDEKSIFEAGDEISGILWQMLPVMLEKYCPDYDTSFGGMDEFDMRALRLVSLHNVYCGLHGIPEKIVGCTIRTVRKIARKGLSVEEWKKQHPLTENGMDEHIQNNDTKHRFS